MDKQELQELTHIFNTVYLFVRNNRQASGYIIANAAMVRFAILLKAHGRVATASNSKDEWPDGIEERWEALK